MKFYWIDDYPARRMNNRALERSLPGTRDSSEFVDATKAFHRKLKKLTSGQRKPDLVVIDHFLNNASAGLIKVGTSVAGLIRDKFPSCPIVGVTSADRLASIDSSKRLTYDGLYSADDLGLPDYQGFVALAQDFRKVASSKLDLPDSINKLLRAPKENGEKLAAIIPDTIQKNLKDPSLPSQLWRWVREDMFQHPGCLFNLPWAANHVGLSPKSFKKHSGWFTEAEYKGIFSGCVGEPLWWPSELNRVLVARLPGREFTFPWEAGQFLTGIKDGDRSRCYRCRKLGPESMGYVDEENHTNWVPLHLRCSHRHPRVERKLFFEDIRVMA